MVETKEQKERDDKELLALSSKGTGPSAEKVNTVGDAKPNTIIRDDWAAIGAAGGYAPRKAEDLRLWIVGPSGEGKTTFLNSIPEHLILDFEDGACSSPGSLATRIHVKNYEHYLAIIDKLVADAKKGNSAFHRISFDTVDRWGGMIKLQLEKEKKCDDITEFGSQGHGYNMILNRCWGKVMRLEESGYVWGCAGHLKLKTEVDPITRKERTVPRPSIYPSFAARIQGEADFQLTIYNITKTVDKVKVKTLPGGKKINVPDGKEEKATYYVNSLTTADKEGKGRGVPTMNSKIIIPLVSGWSEFSRQYEEAVEEAKKLYS
jgi:hypothetical protein